MSVKYTTSSVVRTTVTPSAGGTQRNEFEAAIKSVTSSITVGAVFLYDVSADSDGGAWRKKCKGLSWFDEASGTNRSARSEFPSMCLIVADNAGGSGNNGAVTLYDLDDPAMPVYMVFDTTNPGWLYGWNLTGSEDVSSLFALNGRLYVGLNGTNGVLGEINFVEDYGQRWNTSNLLRYAQPISSRNTNHDAFTVSTAQLVNRVVNDVAATVLEGAEIGALGLPIPTVAVATDGGVSVIHPSGDVYNLASTGGTYDELYHVFFTEDGQVGYAFTASASQTSAFSVGTRKVPFADSTIAAWNSTNQLERYNPVVSSGVSGLTTNTSAQTAAGAAVNAVTPTGKDGLAIGYGDRLSIIKRNPGNMEEGAVAYITSAYNTGYMVGDIRFAGLANSKTTDNSVKGNTLTESGSLTATKFNDDLYGYSGFSASNYLNKSFVLGSELVTNGDFSSGLAVNEWNDASTGTGSIAHATNVMNVVGAGLSNRGKANMGHATNGLTGLTIGEHYRFQFTLGGVTNPAIRIDDGSFTGTDYTPTEWTSANPGNGTHEFIFKAVTTSLFVQFEEAGTGTMTVDNVSLKLASDIDFSTPAKGGNGNSTGDFSIMFWVKVTEDDEGQNFISRSDSSTENGDWLIQMQDAGGVNFFVGVPSWTTVLTGSAGKMVANQWTQIMFVRRSGTLNSYFDGVLDVSVASTHALTPNSSLTVGHALGETSLVADNSSLSLLRISATAPTPQQIKEIYDAEKPLFQAGAKCLLDENPVNDLAYDKTSGLLHVASETTDDGKTFRGLEAVGSLTSDGTFGLGANKPMDYLSASGGVVAGVGGETAGSDDTSGVGVNLPALDVRAELNEGEDKLPDDGKFHFEGVTSLHATPTIIGQIPVALNENVVVKARVTCKTYNFADLHSYYAEITTSFQRKIDGTFAISNEFSDPSFSTTDFSGVASMDVTVSANAAPNTVKIEVTGHSSRILVWTASVEVQRISEKKYER